MTIRDAALILAVLTTGVYVGFADIVRLREIKRNRLPGGRSGILWRGFVVAKVRSAGGALGESSLGQAVAQRNDRKKETPQRLFEIHHQETERNLRGGCVG